MEIKNEIVQEFSSVCCAFCYSGSEKRLADVVNKTTDVFALAAMKIKKEKRNGEWKDVLKPLLPGYVFLYGESEEQIHAAARRCGLRLLKYSDNTAELCEEDREFAQMLLDCNGELKVSKVIREGDRIKVVDGPLLDYNGVVTQIDKRHRLAKITLEIGNITAWLSFEYVDVENGEE